MKPYTAFTAIALLSVATSASSQSLSSLHIGDPASSLSTLGTPTSYFVGNNGRNIRHWLMPNGNDLSVTTDQANHIVYIEADWNGKDDSTACDLPALHFGKTTLTELRKRFGSNGFTFKDQGSQLLSEDGAVLLNSYEAGNVVVTFYNKLSNTESTQLNGDGQSTIADHARLDAISIAAADYAKDAWGDRVYDPNYKKVDWK